MDSPSQGLREHRVAREAHEPQPQWVPVKRLTPRWREAIKEHLIELSEQDRYLRFGAATSDERIRHYVDGLRFEHDDIVGVFNRRLQLVALAHLAIGEDAELGIAEYGISVSAHLRGSGYGKRLFAHAVLMARNRGVGWLKIHALAENATMLHIAAAAGATVERDGSQAQAILRLPAASAGSRWEVWLEAWAGGLDFRLKQSRGPELPPGSATRA